ncbi:protein KRI1 homolog isoform X2 [Eurosta solidaginis]|uniref:protein KRI1 homolog isoform X2 n=1 Tax=Eurosta solidaginis TaxID=178769 RepID=UPI003530A5B9
MSRNLFDASDESEAEDIQLGTNKEYAKSYNNFRQKELLKKFKDRGYGVADSHSSSESDTSSEEDDQLDTKFDQEFLKTLASLKSKNPVIYDKETIFFEALNDDHSGDESKGNSKKEKSSKPVTIKDYERQIILEKGGKFEDDSEADSDDVASRPASPTVVEEERRLKEELKKAMNSTNSDEDDKAKDTFGGIFKKRKKSKEEQDKEEADYLKWLAGKKDDIEDPIKEQLEPLKTYWSSTKLPQSERFLRDFILNKGYADTKTSEIPTYDEIVGDNQPLSEDEEELEKQAEFEQKYNFRFEEPDADFIKRYPRTIEQSLRQTDDRRKQKRQEIKERKKIEKEQKMKELDIIKEMKRKEIEEKIRKLKMVTGNDELGFKDEELEEDFDPEAHDKRMRELFNEEYYEVDEGEEKPECPSDIEELKMEDWDNYDPNKDDEVGYYDDQHCEDDDFNMDCDYDPETAKEQLQKELIENTKKRKGRKGRKSKFMEMIKTEKPAFNPEDEKTYEEYVDEYYKLDCEDMIGDIPCRFKYVETTPNDFGLTIEEILLAKNKELNQWASLKKTIQIRPDYVEKKDQRLYKMKAKNEALKRKIFKSLYGEGSDEEENQKEKASSTEQNLETTSVVAGTDQTENADMSKKANKRKKRKAKPLTLNDDSATADVPEKKLKLSKATEPQAVAESTSENVGTETKSKKKRKKRKSKVKVTEDVLKTSPNSETEKKLNTNVAGHHILKQKQHNKCAKKSAHSANPFKVNKINTGKGPISERKTTLFTANKKQKVQLKPNTKKFNNTNKAANSDVNISDERLKAYGINPKKFHKKQKYGKPQD